MTTPYQMFPNGFRRDMLARKPLIGCWSSLASPIAAEVLGLAGFDWILLDAEHAPNDVTTLIPQLMALKDSVSAPVVRPPWNEPVIIKRLLDAGVVNLLIPFIESADDARRAVAATRYPPAGIRGVAVANRHNRYGTQPNYFASANENMCVLVQVESQRGLDAIDEICAVEGIDGVFVGPSDLAAALGHLGNNTHPQVQDAIRHILSRCVAHGRAGGILTGVEAEARRYMEWGATFVAVGADIGLLRSSAQALRERFRTAG